ncbi:cuticle protein 8-like [Palaemon carinicauda]|uniref:cuticle protein 8-like n=1 Tax=Palaemon carinicauda TaxID=392227 RepID=UPI0035B5C387
MALSKISLVSMIVMLAVTSEIFAAPQLRQPINSPTTIPRYEFGYEVNAPEYGNDFAHAESRDGDTTSGQYRVLLPDGRVQIVSYTVVGDSGYVAQVSYQ